MARAFSKMLLEQYKQNPSLTTYNRAIPVLFLYKIFIT
jgi:hypothetical protein